MTNIPQNVIDCINANGTIKVLTTADSKGQPHAIVCGSIACPQPDKMMVAEILMKKAAENLTETKKAAFTVVSGTESYEIVVKNPVHISEGQALDEVNKKIAAMHLTARALWMFDVDSVYNQSASGDAGKKIA